MKIFIYLFFLFSCNYATENSFIDPKNGLEWQDTSEAENQLLIWKMAGNYCKSLNLDSHDDWRLPTRTELDTLLPIAQHKVTNKNLKFSSENEYWTKDEYEEDDTQAWEIHIGSGHPFFDDKCEKSNVRCVRKLVP